MERDIGNITKELISASIMTTRGILLISWYTAHKRDLIELGRNRPGLRSSVLLYTGPFSTSPGIMQLARHLVVLQLSENLLTLRLGGSEVANHVEGTLGKVVTLTAQNSLEGSDGLLEVDELALDTSENLGDSERLAQETLDLTGTLDGKLVSLRQLVHAQNGNDILETLVLLEDLLDTESGVVVLLADNSGVEHTGGGVERVDSRVDTQLRDTTGQDSGGVQVSEGGGRGRISQIISRDVDGLDGSDGTLLGGGNTLLHTTHVDSESGLVTDGRGDTTEQGRHLGTGLSETENVVNEEQDYGTLLAKFFLS
jgi:hypothetical protein